MAERIYPKASELIHLLHNIEDTQNTTAARLMADHPETAVHHDIVNLLERAHWSCMQLIQGCIDDPEMGSIIGYLLSNRGVKRG